MWMHNFLKRQTLEFACLLKLWIQHLSILWASNCNTFDRCPLDAQHSEECVEKLGVLTLHDSLQLWAVLAYDTHLLAQAANLNLHQQVWVADIEIGQGNEALELQSLERWSAIHFDHGNSTSHSPQTERLMSLKLLQTENSMAVFWYFDNAGVTAEVCTPSETGQTYFLREQCFHSTASSDWSHLHHALCLHPQACSAWQANAAFASNLAGQGFQLHKTCTFPCDKAFPKLCEGSLKVCPGWATIHIGEPWLSGLHLNSLHPIQRWCQIRTVLMPSRLWPKFDCDTCCTTTLCHTFPWLSHHDCQPVIYASVRKHCPDTHRNTRPTHAISELCVLCLQGYKRKSWL